MQAETQKWEENNVKQHINFRFDFPPILMFLKFPM